MNHEPECQQRDDSIPWVQRLNMLVTEFREQVAVLKSMARLFVDTANRQVAEMQRLSRRKIESVGEEQHKRQLARRRGELQELRQMIKLAKQELHLLHEAQEQVFQSAFCASLPRIPRPSVAASVLAKDVPAASGVYFVWTGEVVSYVGQAVNLKNRCALNSHEHIEDGDWLSFIEVPVTSLDRLEAIYIGLLMPKRNGPARAAARRARESGRTAKCVFRAANDVASISVDTSGAEFLTSLSGDQPRGTGS